MAFTPVPMMPLVIGGGALAMFGIHAMTLWGWMRAWKRATTPDEAEPNQSSGSGQTVDWAVVIPARNEAHSLSNLLDDLQVQNLDPVDIWIVDDHSEDDTLHVAQRHPLAQQGHLRVIGNDGMGKKSAILTGIARAQRSWVVTVDADVCLPFTWASSWASALSQASSQTAAIAGPVVLSKAPQSPGLWDGVQALDFAAQMGWSAGCLATQTPGSASGANFALRCDVYPDTRHLGASGDDALVVQTLQQQGWQVDWLADPRAIVTTPGSASISEWVAQRLRWAGKTKHYPWRTQRTAWWMASMAATQWGLVVAALLMPQERIWQIAVAWWVGVTALNVWFARPVAKWFGLRVRAAHWLVLGLTQPMHVPMLLLAKMGLLNFVGIPSHPTWKGRTCTS